MKFYGRKRWKTNFSWSRSRRRNSWKNHSLKRPKPFVTFHLSWSRECNISTFSGRPSSFYFSGIFLSGNKRRLYFIGTYQQRPQRYLWGREKRCNLFDCLKKTVICLKHFCLWWSENMLTLNKHLEIKKLLLVLSSECKLKAFACFHSYWRESIEIQVLKYFKWNTYRSWIVSISCCQALLRFVGEGPGLKQGVWCLMVM